MFCFKCGATMPDTSPACPRCGAAASAASPPSVPAAAPAPVSPRLNVPPTQPYSGQQETDGKAVGSLILGILAIFPLGLFAGIPAVILGHLSRKSIRESLGRLKGDGMALAGLIMGYLSVAAIPLVLMIAAIAIPSLLRSKMMANQSAARSTVRTVNTSQVIYSTQYPSKGYAADLATLGPGPARTCPGTEGTQEYACLIDATLGCAAATGCTKNGYKFSLKATCADGVCTDYVVVAVPAVQGSTGTKSFCSTADAVIRAQTGGVILTPPTVAECQTWNPL